MGKIDNTRRIVREDYESKDHALIDKLGFVLNSFMEQTVRQVNGNLDSENFKSSVITVKLTVDSSGVPKGNNLIKSDVIRPIGTTVKSATNKTDGNVFPTSHPFITFTTGTNSKVLKIRHISGLQADNEYELVIKIE